MTTHTQSLIRKTILTILAFVAIILTTGCSVHVRPRGAVVYHHPAGKVVVLEKGHVHSHRCGHYHHHGRWYYVRGHVHGPGCGHALVGGVWVLRTH